MKQMSMLMCITSKWLSAGTLHVLFSIFGGEGTLHVELVERSNFPSFRRIKINMLPPGKSLSPLISPSGGPLSQGLRKTPMASPLSPYHNGGSILRSPVTNHARSPGTLPTMFSPGRSPASQTPVRGSPTSSWVSSSSFVCQVMVIHDFYTCFVFLRKSLEVETTIFFTSSSLFWFFLLQVSRNSYRNP